MTVLSKKGQLVFIILAAAILFCGGYQYSQIKHSQNDQEILISDFAEKQTPEDATDKELVVHVAGEVANPGIYKLTDGKRVIDAIDRAHATENADLDQLNLAAHLVDEQKVYVPPKRNIDNTGSINSAKGSLVDNLVNINAASPSELSTLPGIGPVLADRIVQYREKNGSFTSLEDLLNVSGIGNTRFSEIEDLISLW